MRWTRLLIRLAALCGWDAWAKGYAKRAIDLSRRRQDLRLHRVAAVAGIALPPDALIRQGRLIRTKSDSLKLDQVVLVDGERFRITRLIRSSAAETVYEADLA